MLLILAAILLGSAQSDAPVLAGGEALVFGETHGSNEIPTYFLQQVRREAQRHPVTVGLEISPSSALLDCRRDDPRRLPPSWRRADQDGRSSLAMRTLLCALRSPALAQRVRVVFLDDEFLGDETRGDDFDRRAATRFREVQIAKGGVGMILTGNLHARNNAGSLAAHLRQLGAIVRTVTVSAPVAETWICSGEPNVCGPQRSNINFCSTGPAASRALRWQAIADRPFRWDYCLSMPRLTASPPAAGTQMR